jgi:pimeloyl-ACP methyl ester carboxylesterase
MTWIVEAALTVLVLGGALLGVSVLAARWIERAVPPQGGVVDVGGETLHVLDRGRGPPLVLIHGLGGQMGNFTHSLVDRLAGDFRVVAFDRPGSGYSTRARGAPAGMRAQADTLAKAIRALGLERPTIVGHSLGGALALTLALDHPDCVGALALIAPATHPIPRAPGPFRALAIRSPELRRPFAWTVATPGALVGRNLAMKELFAPEPPPPDFATAGGGLLGVRPLNVENASADLIAFGEDLKSLPGRYASIRVPAGVLCGRDDHILDWRVHGEALKQKIPALDFELVDGGHMLPVTQPDVCAAFIRRIAAKVPARLTA